MSVEALSWALDQEVGDSTRKCILLILADVADRAGESWYGQKKLAERAECSPRTLRRHLGALEEQGVITKKARRRSDGSTTTNLYRLKMAPEPPGQSDRGGGHNDRTDYPPGQNDRSPGHERPGPRSSVSGGTEPSREPLAASAADAREDDEPAEDGNRFEQLLPDTPDAVEVLEEMQHPGGRRATAATLATSFLYDDPAKAMPDPSVRGRSPPKRRQLVGRALLEMRSQGSAERWSPRALAGFIRRLDGSNGDGRANGRRAGSEGGSEAPGDGAGSIRGERRRGFG